VKASLVVAVVLSGLTTTLAAQSSDQSKSESKFEVYGFAMADAGYSTKQGDPAWFDVLRTTKLPAFKDQFAPDGQAFFSVRQTRFGVRTESPTNVGTLKTQFEFELFGVGVDAGQTTFRLRHAWGQWKQIGAGQTNSTFMDGDVFPNSLEYWGPNGMLFFRNVQVFYEPIAGNSNLRIAIERPGASGDAGVYADRIQLQNVRARFPMPDFTGHYRVGRDWGYVQVGGALRYFKVDDLLDDQFDLDGSIWGWGLALSSNLKVTPRDTARLMFVYGEGVQNYFNDAPVDVGVKNNFSNPVTPIVAEALPDIGVVAFLDHNWNDRWSTAVGYSLVDIDNSSGQSPDAYKRGQYALVNLLHTPTRNVMMGGELQWADRENNSDGFKSSDVRLQFSFKYSFNVSVGGQ
jgi:hypothetical protein